MKKPSCKVCDRRYQGEGNLKHSLLYPINDISKFVNERHFYFGLTLFYIALIIWYCVW